MKTSSCATEVLTLTIVLGLGARCGGRTQDAANAVSADSGADAAATTATGGTAGIDAGCQSTITTPPCYSRMTATLEGQPSSIVCDIPLGVLPPEPSQVVVTVDCTSVALVANHAPGSSPNGFSVDYSETPTHLVFLGTSCQMLQSNGKHYIDIVVGCDTP